MISIAAKYFCDIAKQPTVLVGLSATFLIFTTANATGPFGPWSGRCSWVTNTCSEGKVGDCINDENINASAKFVEIADVLTCRNCNMPENDGKRCGIDASVKYDCAKTQLYMGLDCNAAFKFGPPIWLQIPGPADGSDECEFPMALKAESYTTERIASVLAGRFTVQFA
jgi:hypothetical protein